MSSTRTKATILERLLLAAFSILVFAAASAVAQSQEFTMQVPGNMSQCVPATIQWTGGIGPYALIATPNPVTPVDVVEVHFNITGHSFTWTPQFDTHTYILLVLSDSTGAAARSEAFMLSESDDTSCLRSQPTTTSSSSGATSTADAGESVGAPSMDTSSRGLSGGAIAGIVIGCLVAVIALAFLVILIWRKRMQAVRKRRRATRPNWQPLADLPSRGGYAFSGGAAQREKKNADTPAWPASALNRPGKLAEGVTPQPRTPTENLPEYPPTSPV